MSAGDERDLQCDRECEHPELDLIGDKTSSGQEAIAKKVVTSFTALMIIGRILVPNFLASKQPCSIIFISWASSYLPVHLFPVYGLTKTGLHFFGVSFWAQLVGLTAGYWHRSSSCGHSETRGTRSDWSSCLVRDKLLRPTSFEESRMLG
jgi:hypothetical protein